MNTRYQERTLAGLLRKAARSFPAVLVTGPRQSGKTTLVRRLFGDTHAYCSLDDPQVRALAASDPTLLLARFPPPVILDEIQYAPDLLHAVKRAIDDRRAERGRFVITGSQAFPLMQGVTESLAGRVAVTSLLSLSLREAAGQPDPDRRWREVLDRASAAEPLDRLCDRILRGGYPDPALDRSLDSRLWHASYVQTYLERDVRALRAVGDLGDFQRLLTLLAVRSGSLLNFEDLAGDLGVTGKTVRAWITVLEASGQVLTVRPYHANVGKRLVKRPKVYLLDTGTLAYLLGINEPQQVLSGVAAGPLIETAVLGQLQRLFAHRGETARVYFWRTAAGHEVDFVVEVGGRLIPFEAKLTATPHPREAAGIEAFQRLLGRKVESGYVVCLCPVRTPLARTVEAVPLGAF